MAATEPILASSLWTRPSKEPTSPNSGSRFDCKTIDAALKDGLDFGRITCISTEPDAGARDLTHSLIVSHLLGNRGTNVTVIDTGHAVDVRRLYRAIFAASSDGSEESKKASARTNLCRVKLMKTFDFEGLTEGVRELRDSLERRLFPHELPPRSTVQDSQEDEDDTLDSPTPPPPKQGDITASIAPQSWRSGDILIIDNIAQLADPMIKANRASGQALLASFMRSLSHLSKAHNLCTVIINGTTPTKSQNYREESPSAFSSCAVRPALGTTWTHLVDVHLLLHDMPKTGNDAGMIHGGQKLNGDNGMVHVVEVLQDRCDGRVGRWAAFGADGTGG